MDPKMDAGMNQLSKNQLQDLLSIHFTPLKNPIGLIDELFVQLICWIQGSPLSLSVYSCILLQQPQDQVTAHDLKSISVCSPMTSPLLLFNSSLWHHQPNLIHSALYVFLTLFVKTVSLIRGYFYFNFSQ